MAGLPEECSVQLRTKDETQGAEQKEGPAAQESVFDFDEPIEKAIQEFNEAGVDMKELSPSDRRRALDLETALTEAANKGDIEKFITLVDQWKQVLLSPPAERIKPNYTQDPLWSNDTS